MVGMSGAETRGCSVLTRHTMTITPSTISADNVLFYQSYFKDSKTTFLGRLSTIIHIISVDVLSYLILELAET